jgi:hypothetical protein
MKNKSTMYAQGDGWIVSSWSDDYECYVSSSEMPYWSARAQVGSDNCKNPDTCQVASHMHFSY